MGAGQGGEGQEGEEVELVENRGQKSGYEGLGVGKWQEVGTRAEHFGYETNKAGVPAVAQRDQLHLCRPGTQVQSPARHSGLRIRCRCSYSIGHNCGSDLIPGPGTPYALGRPQKVNI